jgi:hypothetical protein
VAMVNLISLFKFEEDIKLLDVKGVDSDSKIAVISIQFQDANQNLPPIRLYPIPHR